MNLYDLEKCWVNHVKPFHVKHVKWSVDRDLDMSYGAKINTQIEKRPNAVSQTYFRCFQSFFFFPLCSEVGAAVLRFWKARQVVVSNLWGWEVQTITVTAELYLEVYGLTWGVGEKTSSHKLRTGPLLFEDCAQSEELNHNGSHAEIVKLIWNIL